MSKHFKQISFVVVLVSLTLSLIGFNQATTSQTETELLKPVALTPTLAPEDEDVMEDDDLASDEEMDDYEDMDSDEGMADDEEMEGEMIEIEIIPFSSDRWEISAQESEIVEYMGRESLYLNGGLAVVADSEFTDGIIQFDVAFDEERGFPGVVWRLQDLENFERFYMRPHQSGNADATQYTPVYNGVSAWQLYSGPGFTMPAVHTFNEWFTVEVVVVGEQAEVYLNDLVTPTLFIPNLKRGMEAGQVGLYVEAGFPDPFAPAYFSNFGYITLDDEEPLSDALATSAEESAVATDTVEIMPIESWLVSNVFTGTQLMNKLVLTDSDKENLTWTELVNEPSGLANLSRVAVLNPRTGENTVFVQTTIIADEAKVQPLQIGFSDEVRVYLNDMLIFQGNDTAYTRDYRFLGTAGYYDTIYLQLEEGENELWLAVSETFGGWGVLAQLEGTEGVTVTLE